MKELIKNILQVPYVFYCIIRLLSKRLVLGYESAIKCYEKVGVKKEKLIVNSSKASDGYWNLYEMSILRSK